MTTDQEVRFWSKIVAVDDCLEWIGSTNAGGYGSVGVGNRQTRLAHRVLFEHLFGKVPEGMELDHLCRNRNCVKPSHLEVVDRRTNVRRGISPFATKARQTHCKWGHEFTADNLVRCMLPNRACRQCNNVRSGAWQKGISVEDYIRTKRSRRSSLVEPEVAR